MESAYIELEGHIFDSRLFEKVLDTIRARGAEYRVLEIQTGRASTDTSSARIEVSAPDAALLAATLDALGSHGARVLPDTAIDPIVATETTAPREATVLPWGRRYLVCPPDAFTVAYEINPWMHTEVAIDRDRAFDQWTTLTDTLRAAGAELEILPPVEALPDLVFTANAGLIDGDTFIPASFRHPQRQRETPHATAWFLARGFQVRPLAAGLVHEGAGDALPFNDVLISGYRIRSDASSHAAVARIARAQVRAIELVDPRLYHLDLTFCPLDSRRAICAPSGWDDYGRRVIRELVPEPLDLTEEEASAFIANSVVVDRTVIMPSVTSRIERQLRAWGFEVVVVDVSEFLKAGGACRCLTLALDVRLGPA